MFYDTHTHLYLEEFDSDRDQALKRATDAGILRFFLPNIDSSSIEAMMYLTRSYPDRCFPMMGLHPCSVKENYNEELALAEEWLNKEKFYGIGEIGIDLYWDKTFIEEQKEAFRIQIGWAKERSLPIIIHARDSINEIFEIVDELNDDRLSGIFHCFTGSVDDAKKIIGYGNFYLGIGGVATFKNSGLDKTLSQIGPEYLVLETDSPYLAPVPFRGKRNESSYITFIASRLAEIFELSVKEIGEITTANANKVFNL